MAPSRAQLTSGCVCVCVCARARAGTSAATRVQPTAQRLQAGYRRYRGASRHGRRSPRSLNRRAQTADCEGDPCPRNPCARRPRPPPTRTGLAKGATIGRYVVLGLLGRGGMGEVYAAYDPELDRKIAVKLLRARGGGARATRDGRTRLLREAQAIARLSHPNVVVVYDVGTFKESVFIAMEFVEGNTLGYWLQAEHPALARGARRVPGGRARPRRGARGRARPPRLQARQRHAHEAAGRCGSWTSASRASRTRDDEPSFAGPAGHRRRRARRGAGRDVRRRRRSRRDGQARRRRGGDADGAYVLGPVPAAQADPDRGRCSARPPTWRPSSSPGRAATRAPTSSRSASRSTRASTAAGRSTGDNPLALMANVVAGHDHRPAPGLEGAGLDPQDPAARPLGQPRRSLLVDDRAARGARPRSGACDGGGGSRWRRPRSSWRRGRSGAQRFSAGQRAMCAGGPGRAATAWGPERRSGDRAARSRRAATSEPRRPSRAPRPCSIGTSRAGPACTRRPARPRTSAASSPRTSSICAWGASASGSPASGRSPTCSRRPTRGVVDNAVSAAGALPDPRPLRRRGAVARGRSSRRTIR